MTPTQPPHPTPSQNTVLTGIVIQYQSNVYDVLHNQTVYQCSIKGNLKKEGIAVLVGDRVELDSLDEVNQTARVVSVQERSSELSRPKVSNVTQSLIVCAVKQPDLDLHQLDRYLTHVNVANLPAVICFNKVDLLNPEELEAHHATMQLYKELGYAVVNTSIYEPERLQELTAHLSDQTTVLTGPSGVGKSSLINSLKPDAQLAVKTVSEKQQKGRHTTRHATIIPIDAQSLVVDSPGFTYLKFDQTPPEQVETSFPEFNVHRDNCRYNNCLHDNDDTDAGCAVLAQQDTIHSHRLESYYSFLEEARQYVEQQQTTSQKEEYGSKTLDVKGQDKGLKLLKLKEKQRQESRRRDKQRLNTMTLDDFKGYDSDDSDY